MGGTGEHMGGTGEHMGGTGEHMGGTGEQELKFNADRGPSIIKMASTAQVVSRRLHLTFGYTFC
jgi:hypothetical protein